MKIKANTTSIPQIKYPSLHFHSTKTCRCDFPSFFLSKRCRPFKQRRRCWCCQSETVLSRAAFLFPGAPCHWGWGWWAPGESPASGKGPCCRQGLLPGARGQHPSWCWQPGIDHRNIWCFCCPQGPAYWTACSPHQKEKWSCCAGSLRDSGCCTLYWWQLQFCLWLWWHTNLQFSPICFEGSAAAFWINL